MMERQKDKKKPKPKTKPKKEDERVKLDMTFEEAIDLALKTTPKKSTAKK